MTQQWDQIEEAVRFIRSEGSVSPEIGLILGTGLGGLADQLQDAVAVSYDDIPHFPKSTAPSHKGQLLFGQIAGRNIVAMAGRLHYYEGYSLQQVTFPVRVMKALGIETLLVTSAVGGMNPLFALGDIILIDDHINLMPDNPLRGINDDRLGPRFPDMSQPYNQEIIRLSQDTARDLKLSAHKGVLVAVPGPNLETRAEYRMLRQFGADVVGMSTVPEIIVAAHAGLKAAAFSIVTDMCLPDALEPADIDKIIAVAEEGGKRLEQLLIRLIPTL